MRNKKRIIEIEVNDEFIVGSGVVLGAAGSHNDVVIRARFNESWVGLSIFATFRDARGENPTAVVLTSATTLKESETDYEVHEFSVPLNVKKYEGKVTLAFLGYSLVAELGEDDEPIYKEAAVISSGTAYFNVLQSDVILADDVFKEANVGERLLDGINKLSGLYGDLDEAADALRALVNQVSTTQVIMWKGDIANLVDEIYPVGAVYISSTLISPADKFGGEWERIEGRFLLGADEEGEMGTIYKAGTIGGSATHIHKDMSTLHAAIWQTKYDSGGNLSTAANNLALLQSEYEAVQTKPTVISAGMSNEEYKGPAFIQKGVAIRGTLAGDNMPPYLTVYMWKRIA